MTSHKHSTVIGVFEDRASADQAVSDLMRAGFRQDQIGVALRNTEYRADDAAGPEDEGSQAGSGAIAGALTGLGLGALAGLGVLAGVIPVVGPAIAAGTLGVVLSNAAAGAGIAGLVGALIGAGIPEEEAEFYHSEFEAGRTIVTVHADGRAEEAMGILRRHGAYDVHDRSRVTVRDDGSPAARASGAASSKVRDLGATAGKMAQDAGSAVSNAAHNMGQAASSALGGATSHRDTSYAAHAGETIQAREERLRAEKHEVETGAVKVRKEVHTENQTIEVPVKREEIVIERTPGHGQPAADISSNDLREGQEIRIPVHEEEVSLAKEAVVNEEVRIGKRTVQDTERLSGQVRKEEIKVDKTGDVDLKNKGK
ncbi:MAG: YsnF/AvaK domain-containing protein [Isosphaeraceae bacterium]